MSTRILHCGKSIENFNICLEHQVFGFTRRGANVGDMIYLVVNNGKKLLCGMRGVLSEVTDFKPWEDSENYVVAFTLEEVEYAEPFDIKFLSKIGGTYWNLKYLQGSKPIKETEAVNLLNKKFETKKTNEPQYLKPLISEKNGANNEEYIDEDATEENIQQVLEDVPEARISIMGTFQTIKFRNETDELRGLEPLVNENFYSLFPAYTQSKSILIAENRLFISSGVEARGDQPIRGIKTIPDALLITFNKKFKCPIQINLIEYECFGERKTRPKDKANYLNGQIIPQLMKFASSFSIVTDKHIREQTINAWVDKIIDYIYKDKSLQDRFNSWIKEIQPDISDQLIGREFDKILSNAFRTNLKVMLIIDDLSAEQKDTIRNVINAFRLENGESINFLAYVVRLEQRIMLNNSEAEFALSVQ